METARAGCSRTKSYQGISVVHGRLQEAVHIPPCMIGAPYDSQYDLPVAIIIIFLYGGTVHATRMHLLTDVLAYLSVHGIYESPSTTPTRKRQIGTVCAACASTLTTINNKHPPKVKEKPRKTNTKKETCA